VRARWSDRATFVAAIIRAPMMSVVHEFEITDDDGILVPLRVANLSCFVIRPRVQPARLHEALKQDAIHVPGR
jgi:H+/Cl- antiporter ClcA